MTYQNLDGTPLSGPIVGLGCSGIIISHNRNVLKVPHIYRSLNASSEQAEIEEMMAEQFCMRLENEKQAYIRLGHHENIIDCVNLSEEGIEMPWMKNGPLSRYLETQKPSPQHIAQWISELANAISHVHSKNVIIGDIASRNVLLADDMSLKLCDFSDVGIMPLDCDMSHAVHYGLSVRTDILQFGSVVYEISPG